VFADCPDRGTTAAVGGKPTFSFLAETLDDMNLYYWEDTAPAEIDDAYTPPQDYYPLQI
jgi:hypothetical protein